MIQRTTTTDRVPPQDLEAERAVLGSVLLDNAALGDVLTLLKPGDFYRGTHQVIFDTIADLFDRGSAIDVVILRDELSRTGNLEKAGGEEALHDLAVAVPTAANADYYARIVRDRALRRAVIHSCTDAIRQAYDGDMEGRDLLDYTEGLLFKLDRETEAGETVHIGDILTPLFKEIDGGGTGAHGVQSPIHELNDLTDGLHPSQLVVIAGRPSMGKTTFALNLAEHAGVVEKIPVAIFSLEMSKGQVVTNMLCSNAKVNAHSLRRGTVQPDEWPRLSAAAGRLSEAPIFIDDTPALSVLAMRAKVRRLKARHGIGLVIVDYLQLMESSRAENRQQEISMISRSLKGLAREMEVPVISISQLNRSVDAREDHRPRMSDLRECVTGETLVQLADGRRRPIRELVGECPRVLAVNEAGRIERAVADRIWCVGRRPVRRIALRSGRSIRVTAEHRLMAFDGWRSAKTLSVGDRLAIARRIPEPEHVEKWPDLRVALLGQLIGDGSDLCAQPMRYTTVSEENAEIVRRAAEGEFGARVTRHAGRGTWFQLVIAGNGNRWHPRGVGKWLKDLGIFDERSHEKRLPESAFRLPDEQVALLLRHLWATDGAIFTRTKGRGSHRVYYSTSSAGLAADVAALLLRLGIVARIQVVPQGTHRPGHAVLVSGTADQRRFLERVGAFGPRTEPARKLAAALEPTTATTNVDTVPRACFGRVKQRMRAQAISQREMAALRGTSYGGDGHLGISPSRTVLAESAELLDDDELRSHAMSDLFWDEISEIREEGAEEVYDLSVPGPSCWLADAIVSHNSGAIEQDADIIMFLYRDEYYDPREDNQGIAEVLVAKQRNGPTGTVKCTFLSRFMRFENLANYQPPF